MATIRTTALPIPVEVFAVATFLCGADFHPVGYEERDGKLVFLFPAEASGSITEYRIHNSRLSQLMTEARTR